MKQYVQLQRTVNNMLTKSLSLLKLLHSIEASISGVDLVRDELENTGNSKLASKYGKVSKLLLSIQKDLRDKKLRKILDIKERLTEVQSLISELNPEEYKSNQAIEDTFTPEGVNTLKVSLPEKQLMAIDRAPMLLLSKTPPRGKALKLLQSLNAIFYKGTNGILLPDVPVLIVNLNIINHKVMKPAVAEILKEIKPNNTPVPLHSISKTVGHVEVIPCFKKEYVTAIDELFAKVVSKQLLVEEK